jgi:hypothetical protein
MKSLSRFLAACLLLLLVGCGDKAKDLYDTAQLEEKQNNKPHATKLYRQIVEEYPGSSYANHGEDSSGRVGERESALSIHQTPWPPLSLWRLAPASFFLEAPFRPEN